MPSTGQVDAPGGEVGVDRPGVGVEVGPNAGAGFVVGVLTGSFDATALAREPHTHLLASVAERPGLAV